MAQRLCSSLGAVNVILACGSPEDTAASKKVTFPILIEIIELKFLGD